MVIKLSYYGNFNKISHLFYLIFFPIVCFIYLNSWIIILLYIFVSLRLVLICFINGTFYILLCIPFLFFYSLGHVWFAVNSWSAKQRFEFFSDKFDWNQNINLSNNIFEKQGYQYVHHIIIISKIPIFVHIYCLKRCKHICQTSKNLILSPFFLTFSLNIQSNKSTFS